MGQAWRIIVSAFKSGYEYIGIMMLANVVWFIVAFFPLLVVTLMRLENSILFLAGLVGTVITFGPATAGIHYMINKLVHKEETTIKDFKLGFRMFFGRGVAIVLLNLLLVVILYTNLLFSINNPNNIIRLLSGIWIYFMLFWLVFIQYLFPFMVQQQAKVLVILKRAALVAIDNVLVSILITLMNAVIAIISIIFAAPLLLFFMGLTAFVQNYALVEILKKYDDGHGIA